MEESESENSDFDEDYYILKPPPISYEEIAHRIVKIRPNQNISSNVAWETIKKTKKGKSKKQKMVKIVFGQDQKHRLEEYKNGILVSSVILPIQFDYPEYIQKNENQLSTKTKSSLQILKSQNDLKHMKAIDCEYRFRDDSIRSYYRERFMLSKIKIKQKLSYVFISKLCVYTIPEDVLEYISFKLGNLPMLCEQVTVKQRNYAAFKIGIVKSYYYKLLEASFWPQRVTVSKYEQRETKTKEQSKKNIVYNDGSLYMINEHTFGVSGLQEDPKFQKQVLIHCFQHG